MHIAEFDASTKHRKRKTQIGYVIYSPDGKVVCKCSKSIEYMDSNDAEWYALLEVMKDAKELNIKYIKIYGDCQSVIDTCNTKQPKKNVYHKRIKELELFFDTCKYEWIKRKKNTVADSLSKGKKVKNIEPKKHSESIEMLLWGINTKYKNQFVLKSRRAERREKKILWR